MNSRKPSQDTVTAILTSIARSVQFNSRAGDDGVLEVCCCDWDACVIVIVIVIGGLKSRGLTKTYIMCTEKISPIEIPTIPGLSILRADQ
jgi:hypothetical protein